VALVAGIDSSTQSCKVEVRDADTGRLVREGRAAHPDGTEVDPAAWWEALSQAIRSAGGLDDVAAVSVAGQQHGMVCLDETGSVVRPAVLWNDTRSAPQAAGLVTELGGPKVWAEAVGTVPVASLTVTKLRWLAEHEPGNARRTAAVCLPHDWLTWRLAGHTDVSRLLTDRSDASGTGYWSPSSGAYRTDLLIAALGHDAQVPTVLGPDQTAGTTPEGAVLGPGAGDNAASALGLGAGPGDVMVSVGTSGVACAVTETPAADPSGLVAGFADATGRFLPLVATLNAARVLDSTARLLSVDHAGLSDLALTAPPGSGGAVMVPWFEGERSPNRPTATASLHGLDLATWTPAMVARAAVEGLLCGLADGLDALTAQGAVIERVLLTGGGAASAAVRDIAPRVFDRPVRVPVAGQYVARGAAYQAAWVLGGEAPGWSGVPGEVHEAPVTEGLRERYREASGMVLDRTD
jgi:xylulokinase